MIPLVIAYILNIIDYLFTAHWVNKFGIDIETNPLGRWMLENNVAWVFKIFVVGGLYILLLCLVKQHPKVVLVAYILLAVYAVIVIYHIFIAIKVYYILKM